MITSELSDGHHNNIKMTKKMEESKEVSKTTSEAGRSAFVSISDCPFEVGEIAVFTSYMRFEKYISRVMQVHLDYWGSGMIPEISKATNEEKKAWFDNDNYELVIEEIHLC